MIILSFVIPTIAFLIYCIKYEKYSAKDNKLSISGVEVIEKVLERHQITNYYTVEDKSLLVSQYSGHRKIIKLSSKCFHGESLFNIVIGTYLAGLIIYEQKDNKLLNILNKLRSIIDILCIFGVVALLVSLATTSLYYIKISIGIVFVINLFYLIYTFATNNTIKKINIELIKSNLVNKDELPYTKDIINSIKYRNISSIYLVFFNFIYKLFKRA